jgi:cold shock CspA family protein
MIKTGQIKIFSPETGCGVIQADDDSRVVLFFRRPCVVSGYSPAFGDRVSFQRRTSPISGQPEACQITPRIRSAA